MDTKSKIKRLKNIWRGMNARCFDVGHKDFEHYGKRGIHVFQEWRNFENFFADMADTYEDGLTLERLNNNIGYCKKNCVWQPLKNQSKNRRPFSQWKSKYNTREWKKKREQELKSKGKHLKEIRDHLILDLHKKKIPMQDIAAVFGIHPSQVTRSLKIK